MSAVLYNEIEPYAAQWLRNLCAEGHIAPGRVDTRSIVDLRPADLDGVAQFHAFAGIGGWSLALRLAGLPDDFPIWTASCPCQPFSVAGQRGGFSDERHLWPTLFGLVRDCRPAIVVGEQVEAAVRLGWLDAVFADLEGEGYACGTAVLGAHGVGAPHIRLRTWFVADANGRDARAEGVQRGRQYGQQPADGSPADRLADAAGERQHGGELAGAAGASPLGSTEAGERRSAGLREPAGRGAALIVDDAERGRLQGPVGVELHRFSGGPAQPLGGPNGDPWSDSIWLPCRDGKARPAQPGLQPLAHGLPTRVGRLRAYGNAIVPQVAAEFLIAALGLPHPAPPADPTPAAPDTL